MKKLTILRTGAGSLPSPPVIEGLRDLGCRVVAADAEPLSVGFTCADAHAVIPRADDPLFPSVIMDLCREEKINAILPAVNEEIPRFLEMADTLRVAGIGLMTPGASAVETCLDKRKTARALAENGLYGPSTWSARDARERDLSFPVVVKPRRGRGGRGVVVAKGRRELLFFLDQAEEEVIVQALLLGTEHTIDLFCTQEGELRMASARRRLRVNNGVSVAGEIVPIAPFLPHLERLTERLELGGPTCVQCFLDDEGSPHFFDLNPRLGGGVALSLQGGTPILEGIVAALRGEPIPCIIGPGVGLRFLRKYTEVYLDERHRF